MNIVVDNNVSLNYYGNSSYGYGNMLNSNDWVNSANSATDKMKENLGISDSNSTTSTNKTSSTSSSKTSSTSSSNVYTASTTSGFLMGYQNVLKDLESSASKLQTSQANNVFQKYDAARAKAANGDEASVKALGKAEDEVVSSMKDFVDKLNTALSYLKKNTGAGSGVSSQLDSLKRMVPSEKTLKAMGISKDTDGNLKFDEDSFREALQKDPSYTKELVGGQYGIAERAGNKATYILDSSVDKIVGSNGTSGTSQSGSSSSSSSASSALSGSKSTMSDSFLQFASFARGGAYNLSNYYAVSMLNILV